MSLSGESITYFTVDEMCGIRGDRLKTKQVQVLLRALSKKASDVSSPPTENILPIENRLNTFALILMSH